MDVPPELVQLPLFPLRTVLFPGGALPLQIFEVRYLDMIGRCHREGTPFGVVCLTHGAEVRRRVADDAPGAGDAFATEAFEAVGTLATITRLERPQPGLLQIEARGTQRFRLHSSVQQPHGLWLGRAELLPADADVPVPEDLRHLSRHLQDVYAQWRAHAGDAPMPSFAAPCRWDDCGWLANRWCELLPLEVARKQHLMALEGPVLRLELVSDLLDASAKTGP